MNWGKFSLPTVAMVTKKNQLSLDTVPKNFRNTISSTHILEYIIWHFLTKFATKIMSRAAKIFTRKQMYRFSENDRQSPKFKKMCVFFSIKFNISSSFISKNVLQYIRAISKCLNETVMIEKSRNQFPTSKMSPKKY